QSSPRSFEHKRLLIEAEQGRVSGGVKKTIALYEQAIVLAQEENFPQIEALATERAAKFYLELGATGAAQTYMLRAHRAYLHWGAIAKADAIEAEYANLLPAQANEARAKMSATGSHSTPHSATESATLLTQTSLGSIRDAALVVAAVQA